ncbi:MAG: hypothetical protein CVU03_04180 [Bacteroidetes bacterium HGW-Bacteroidetes-2]|jgi:hypothetical protein|nr:MAG: hypothetical protein CVU03_04180 [Bacteroidetes bacterium HGW-Bacteroidetes-2]
MKTFYEEQQFNQSWLKVLFIFILVVSLIPLIIFMNQENFDTNSEELWLLFITNTLLVFLFLFLIWVLKLKIKIDTHGIHYAFSPFRNSLKTITWREIKSCEVVSYSPIGDYGGWGYRISFRQGRALNVKGNKGIKIELLSGKKLLLGTQKPIEAQEAIAYFKK